jgi:uracil-DNA glycosylase
MSEPARTNPEEIKRQLRQHLDSLRAAGIQWLPAQFNSADPNPAPESAHVDSPPSSASLAAPTSLKSPELFEPGAVATSLSVEERAQQLRSLADCVSQCTRCPHLAATRTQTVFGVGPLDAEICFIGEAPGATEDARGEPFVGEAGQLLDRIIIACGMTRAQVYICNIIRCRPPGNRVPNAEEAAHCREYLDKQLELVRPRYICCLGACAAQNLLNTPQSIGKMRGRILEYRGIPVMCTYHPAYLLRNPAEKKKVWEDMKMLLAHMGRPVPRA